jgi:hypothetical protein
MREAAIPEDFFGIWPGTGWPVEIFCFWEKALSQRGWLSLSILSDVDTRNSPPATVG